MNDPTDGTAGSGGTTWIYTYDLGGNILSKAAYPYTTGTVGTAVESHTYTYGNSSWKDQLTARDGVMIQYDAIGNPTNDGTWTYTWQHGKQLASMTRIVGNEIVFFEYNEDGLRTKKTVTNGEGTVVTEYVLHGKNIVHMTRGTDELHFFYGADELHFSYGADDKSSVVVYNGTSYRYLYRDGRVIILHNIDQLFSRLSCNADPKDQASGITEASQVRMLSIFFQPIEGKEYWQNCAKIIYAKQDEELRRYCFSMLEWLKDMTWPGSEVIYNRLCQMKSDSLKQWIRVAIKEAIRTDDQSWESALNALMKDISA